MIAFRFHRGGLAESLATIKTFNTAEEMFDYIRAEIPDLIQYFSHHKNGNDLELSIKDKVMYDDRIGWNTQYVLSYGNCIGMCDLNYDPVKAAIAYMDFEDRTLGILK